MGSLAQRTAWTLRLALVLSGGLLATTSHFAHANIGEFTGFGSQAASLGGAQGARLGDAFSAYSNPAALAASSGTRFRFGYHLLFVGQMMTPIPSVVSGNSTFQDVNSTSAVDTAYESIFGQAIGASYQIAPQLWNLSLGAVIYLPLLKPAAIDTGSALLPEYLLYRSRLQRPQIELGLGLHPWGPIHLGVGAHVGFALNSTADVFLQSAAPQASSMRFISTLIPKAAPYLSLLLAPEGDQSAWSVGLLYRFSLVSNNNLYLRTKARMFGALPALDLNFDATGALYFDPATIELSATFSPTPALHLTGQLDYVFWGVFQPPALAIGESSVAQPGITLQPSQNPAFTTRNIFVPHLGLEWVLQRHRLRAGYSYKPSILASAPTGSANPVDPTVHRMNLGYGYAFEQFFGLDRPWTLDFHLSWQAFVSAQVTKTGTTDLGYPGYTTGGNLVGTGVSVSFAL